MSDYRGACWTLPHAQSNATKIIDQEPGAAPDASALGGQPKEFGDAPDKEPKVRRIFHNIMKNRKKD